jgi:hypothetical protein
MNQRIGIVILVAAFAGLLSYFWLRCPQEVGTDEKFDKEPNGPIRDVAESSPSRTPAVTMAAHGEDHQMRENEDRADGVASIADIQLPLYFEDEGLPEKVRKTIEVDLEAVFSTMTTHRRDNLIVNGVEREWLTFEGGQDEVPDVVREEFGTIESVDGNEFFRVSKKLSDAYERALEFRSEHVEEFRALSQTIDRVERMNLSSSPSALNVIVQGRQSEKIQEHVLKLLSEAHLRGPSVLNFGFQEYESDQVLSAKLYVSDASDGASTEIFFIFVDGEWAAVVGTPGT